MGLRTGISIGMGVGIGSGAGSLGGLASQLSGILGATPGLILDAYGGVLNGSGVTAANGETVGTWVNQGTADFSNATQGTDANRMLYQAAGGNGGRPALQCVSTDGLDGTITGSGSGDSWTVWIVGNVTTTTNRCPFEMGDSAASNRGVTFFYTAGPLMNHRWGNAAGNNTATGTPTIAAWKVICGVGSTDVRTTYENDVQLVGGTSGTEGTDRIIAAQTNYAVGRLIAGTFPYVGFLSSIIAMKVEASAAQRAGVQALLAARWGIT